MRESVSESDVWSVDMAKNAVWYVLLVYFVVLVFIAVCFVQIGSVREAFHEVVIILPDDSGFFNTYIRDTTDLSMRQNS